MQRKTSTLPAPSASVLRPHIVFARRGWRKRVLPPSWRAKGRTGEPITDHRVAEENRRHAKIVTAQPADPSEKRRGNEIQHGALEPRTIVPVCRTSVIEEDGARRVLRCDGCHVRMRLRPLADLRKATELRGRCVASSASRRSHEMPRSVVRRIALQLATYRGFQSSLSLRCEATQSRKYRLMRL